MSSEETSRDSSLEKTPVKKETSSENNALIALESMEKLDRCSPDLWPEKIPGVNDFIAMNTTPINASPPSWTRGLSQEDINSMHQLGVLSANGLITEIRKLYDQGYQLGVMEAKEVTRGKYLNIFPNSKRKDKEQ